MSGSSRGRQAVGVAVLLMMLSSAGQASAGASPPRIEEYVLPTSGSSPLGITVGPDRALWFVEYGGNNVGRMTLSHSNRQIAQLLFVTRKTVEWHLSHAYTKLGIDGRPQLATALEQDVAEQRQISAGADAGRQPTTRRVRVRPEAPARPTSSGRRQPPP
jgi:hypothetical protein